jgi:hypothetical protein
MGKCINGILEGNEFVDTNLGEKDDWKWEDILSGQKQHFPFYGQWTCLGEGMANKHIGRQLASPKRHWARRRLAD